MLGAGLAWNAGAMKQPPPPLSTPPPAAAHLASLNFHIHVDIVWEPEANGRWRIYFVLRWGCCLGKILQGLHRVTCRVMDVGHRAWVLAGGYVLGHQARIIFIIAKVPN